MRLEIDKKKLGIIKYKSQNYVQPRDQKLQHFPPVAYQCFSFNRVNMGTIHRNYFGLFDERILV